MTVFSARLEVDGKTYTVRADVDITGYWRLQGGLGGVFRLTNKVLEIDVREGAVREALSFFTRRERLRGLMEAAQQLSCGLGVRVVLRVHGLRVASLECRGEKR